jgi:hypothetical protein
VIWVGFDWVWDWGWHPTIAKHNNSNPFFINVCATRCWSRNPDGCLLKATSLEMMADRGILLDWVGVEDNIVVRIINPPVDWVGYLLCWYAGAYASMQMPVRSLHYARRMSSATSIESVRELSPPAH